MTVHHSRRIDHTFKKCSHNHTKRTPHPALGACWWPAQICRPTFCLCACCERTRLYLMRGLVCLFHCFKQPWLRRRPAGAQTGRQNMALCLAPKHTHAQPFRICNSNSHFLYFKMRSNIAGDVPNLFFVNQVRVWVCCKKPWWTQVRDAPREMTHYLTYNKVLRGFYSVKANTHWRSTNTPWTHTSIACFLFLNRLILDACVFWWAESSPHSLQGLTHQPRSHFLTSEVGGVDTERVSLLKHSQI